MLEGLTSNTVAVREMVALIQRRTRLTEMEAYQLASVAADLAITQLVDGHVGVHMTVAKSLLGR